MWTYFVLLISKLLKSIISNGFIYFFIFCSTIIFSLSIVINKEKELRYSYFSGNTNNINEFISKIKFCIKLFDSFIERNKSIRNESENEKKRYLLLLKGNS